MTTLTKKNIGSARRMAMSALALVATATTIAGLGVAMPATAHAAAPAEARTEMVRYSDLDLATDDGAAKLHGRVYRAARRVCMVDASPLVRLHRRMNACVREAARNGHAQADQKITQHRVIGKARD
jgi:UrcA family protein